MSATGLAGTAAPSRPSPLVLAIRILIVLVSAAALASPVYVALRGSGYLNQAPPPFWGVNAGAGSSGSSTAGHTTAGLGGC